GTFTQVGIYTLAVNFVDVINISCNTIGAVLLTKLTSLKSDAEALQIMRKIFLMISIFNLIAILGMTGFGYWIIKYMYGPAYLDAYLAFLFLIPAIFGLTLGALFNTFLWSKGFPIFTIVAPIMPLIVKAVVNYLLIPRFSLFGASLASSVAYPLWLIILLIWYFGKNKEMHISCLIPLKQDFREIRANILLVKQKVMSLNLR
ncbi:MAG: polysaccharide biosynthesis C-terminal domain-containing protein, partial [Candidatus Cloacimonetes bacterium]|nr:polysaccharide biosynthesis C-terminal domain-containing protein [Candidatus Cloacimonadota bacterium]